MNVATLASISREEGISALVLEILAAIGWHGLREETFLSLARLGPVPDFTRAELKAELNACSECGWADFVVEKRTVRWIGTRAAERAHAAQAADKKDAR